jgi:Domain of unknown function (DUF4407)
MKYPYSRGQHFFWLISGSEISVLRECQNEYNRHANIGMMILITSVFGFFTAYVAGTTFAGGNRWAVLGFATIWALLVFAIDRSMVNSIKKDPDAPAQPFWSFFFARLLLATILAFFMSIPLDHIVFPEAIERQMKLNVHNDWLRRQEELNRGLNVAGTDSTLKTMETQLTDLREELNSECPLPAYSEARQSYDECSQKVPPLRADYENKKGAAANYLNQLPVSSRGRRIVNQTYVALRAARNEAEAALGRQVRECDGYRDDARRIESEWRASKQQEINDKDSRRSQTQDRLNTDRETVRNESDTFKKELAAMTGFDTKFTTLFLMPNWGVQVLKWAIFLALLVIEILPTYLKLKTPVGQYDMKMHEREVMTRNDIEARVASERDLVTQTEAHRVAAEVALNKAVIDRIADIELRLAEEMLEDWEHAARAEAQRNVQKLSQPTPV